MVESPPKALVKNFSFFYGSFQAVKDVSFSLPDKKVMALIGPSGCGKTTLLRSFNRMHDLYPGNRYEGEILLYPEGANILLKEVDPIQVRMRVSMVFQKPNPFPKSIFENVVYGLKVRGVRDKALLEGQVEKSLKRAALWDEVKDRLHKPAFNLSGGQQQRLCIARALAVDPDIVLLDEPTSALDPVATGHIEELIGEIRKEASVLIVTHNMQQAARVSDVTAFMYMGKLVELDVTSKLFGEPREKLTREYVAGQFG